MKLIQSVKDAISMSKMQNRGNSSPMAMLYTIIGLIIAVAILKSTLPTLTAGILNITAGGLPLLDMVFPYLLLIGVISVVFLVFKIRNK